MLRQRLQKYYELWKCNNCRFCLRAFFVGQRYIPTETLGTASIEACHGVRLTTQKLALKWALKCRRDGKYSSPHLAWYLTTRRGSKFLSRRCFGSRSLLLHCYIHCYRERNLMEPLFLENPIAVEIAETRSVLLVSTLGFKCVLVLQAHVLHSIAECPSNWFPQLAENALALPSALRHGLLACYSALCIPRCGASKTRMARYGKVGCRCLLRLVIQFFDVLLP